MPVAHSKYNSKPSRKQKRKKSKHGKTRNNQSVETQKGKINENITIIEIMYLVYQHVFLSHF